MLSKTNDLRALIALITMCASSAIFGATQSGNRLTEQYGKFGPTGGIGIKVIANWAAGPSSSWRQGAMGTTEFTCYVRTGLSTTGNRDYCSATKEIYRTDGYDQNSNTHINVWCGREGATHIGCGSSGPPPLMTHDEMQAIWDYMSGDMSNPFLGGEANLQRKIDLGNAAFKDRLEKSIKVHYAGLSESQLLFNIYPPNVPGVYTGTLTLDMPVTDYSASGSGNGYMVMVVHSIEVVD